MHMESKLGEGSNENPEAQTQLRHNDGASPATLTYQVDLGKDEHLAVQAQSGHTDGNPPAAVSNPAEMHSEPRGGSDDLKIQSHSSINGNDLSVEGASSGVSLTSSSSCGSPTDLDSDDDRLMDFVPKHEGNGIQSKAPEPVHTPEFSNQHPPWSMMSVSPRMGGGYSSSEVFSQNLEWPSPMATPPTQAMGHPPGYDPTRIPSSIFTSKPTSPMDWSIASNESLFSIQMGGQSFTGDQAILLEKSEELNRMEELNNYSPSPPLSSYHVSEAKPAEVNNYSSSLPPLIEVASEQEREQSVHKNDDNAIKEDPSKNSESITEKSAENLGNKASATEEESVSTGVNPMERTLTSSSQARLSNESGKSSSSFAFPVLVNEVGKSGSLRMNSQKREEPKAQQIQYQQPPEETTTNAANTSWYSYFSCCSWPRCCC